MPIQDYSLLSGTVISVLDSVAAQKIDPNGKPHYHVLVDAAGVKYRAAVNVLSDDNPPDLQFYLDDNYQHPILQTIKGFPPGLLPLASQAGTGALDYILEDLLDISKMTIIPPMDGPGASISNRPLVPQAHWSIFLEVDSGPTAAPNRTNILDSSRRRGFITFT